MDSEQSPLEAILALSAVREALNRGFIALDGDRVTYKLHRDRAYAWTAHPEEWVRCASVAMLIIELDYPPARIDLEVQVPRRVPGDYADIVVFRDDRCRAPYLVIECKASGQTATARSQAIEQAIGNSHSLRAPLALYDEFTQSDLFDTSGAYPSQEREQNRRGGAQDVPRLYADDLPPYRYIAGTPKDIKVADARALENKVRRTHSIIWSGGKRDPLTSFDEWSKLLFAKVHDERTTPNGAPRRFQIGANETATAVANRVHTLFASAREEDPAIFPPSSRILLPDQKIFDVVEALQDISIVNTSSDTVGRAFESFFGSVFRGELGQYFTMRQIARFVIAAIEIDHADFIVDPTAGSGGFLLEALLQGWHHIETAFAGQTDMRRMTIDFAGNHVFGIEIHEILARILKINLLLHHDGHTNIEGDRSCLDIEFANAKLAARWSGGFTRVVGNPPFGDSVKKRDRDLLGSNELDAFKMARGRTQVPSEHLILERGIEMLTDGGRLAFVLPDGLLNNQGELSNCPQIRRLLASEGKIEAIVSLPDFAFRKAGAQNKTSILFFQKFTAGERARWQAAYNEALRETGDDEEALVEALRSVRYRVFFAEATNIGYLPTGLSTGANDLYNPDDNGLIAENQSGSILGELQRFRRDPEHYTGHRMPDCTSMPFDAAWLTHRSHRLDPKYFLFKLEEQAFTPAGWVRLPIGEAMTRREELVQPEHRPDQAVTVLTVSQNGDLRARLAGKGRTPPEWRGMYFADMPTKWFAAHTGDVVFSGIDLWKGCISVVPPEFDGALVSSEFPVYRVVDDRLDPRFLSTLLRSRYYQRAFRAITTGHSNRRRTQAEDFEELEICFPADPDTQEQLVAEVMSARTNLSEADAALRHAMLEFSDLIDRRGDEEYPTTVDEPDNDL